MDVRVGTMSMGYRDEPGQEGLPTQRALRWLREWVVEWADGWVD